MRHDIRFVQDLRGVAALAVVLYHASNFLGPYGVGIGGMLFGPSGSMGVALFFIISGFIMVCATKLGIAGPTEAMRFWGRRLVRVLPLYVVATCIFCLVAWIFSAAPVPTAKEILRSLVFLPTGHAPAPVYGWPALNVGWTLNYEMYFYTVFGFSLLFGRLKWAFLYCWFALTVVGLPLLTGHELSLASTVEYGYRSGLLKIATNPVVLMFLVGVTIGLLYKSKFCFSVNISNLSILGGVALLLWQYMTMFHMGHGVTEWGISLIPLVFVLAIASKMVSIPSSKITSYLGGISYSLYLVHPVVLLCYAEAVQILGMLDVAHGFAGMILVASLSIICAHFLNVYVEVGLSSRIRLVSVRALCALKEMAPRIKSADVFPTRSQ